MAHPPQWCCAYTPLPGFWDTSEVFLLFKNNRIEEGNLKPDQRNAEWTQLNVKGSGWSQFKIFDMHHAIQCGCDPYNSMSVTPPPLPMVVQVGSMVKTWLNQVFQHKPLECKATLIVDWQVRWFCIRASAINRKQRRIVIVEYMLKHRIIFGLLLLISNGPLV